LRLKNLGKSASSNRVWMKPVAVKKIRVLPALSQHAPPVEEIGAFGFGRCAQFCIDGPEMLRRPRETLFADWQQPKHKHTRSRSPQLPQ
jgi:hypothetical protein